MVYGAEEHRTTFEIHTDDFILAISTVDTFEPRQQCTESQYDERNKFESPTSKLRASSRDLLSPWLPYISL